MWLFGKCSNYRLGHTDTSLKLYQKEGSRHRKFSLIKRAIKFANALRYNKKRTIKSVFSLLEEDTGSIIGKKSV